MLRHVETIGASMGEPPVQSLLELAAEAEQAQPKDAVTVQLVLSCLTNMSVGSGIEAILRQGGATRMLVGWLVDAEQRTREYSLACVYNLASTTERRLQRLRAVLLDSLTSSASVQPALRHTAKQGIGQTAMHAQMILNYVLDRRIELTRTARSSKESTVVASELASPTALRRAVSFDRAVSDRRVSACAEAAGSGAFAEVDSSDGEPDAAMADAMGGARWGGRWRRRMNGGYVLDRRTELTRKARSSKRITVGSSAVVHGTAGFDRAASERILSADGVFAEADSSDGEADGAMAEAKGGARWGGQMRRRMNGGYNLVLAVIAPEDWAAEVSCVEDGEEQVVTAVAALAAPSTPARAALIPATFASSASPSLRERLPRRLASPPRRRRSSPMVALRAAAEADLREGEKRPLIGRREIEEEQEEEEGGEEQPQEVPGLRRTGERAPLLGNTC